MILCDLSSEASARSTISSRSRREECVRRTNASAFCTYSSTALLAPLAMALTRRGSNLAASSSLTIALETERPSLAVGTVGGREEKDAESEEEMEKDEVTASFSRFVERVR